MTPQLSALLLLSMTSGICWGQNRAAETGSPVALPPLRTVAEIRAAPSVTFNVDRPLSLTGIVTLADESRNLLVLQDATGAVALHPDPPGVPVQPGQRVSLKASACAPRALNRPDYPYNPSGKDIRPSLTVPDDEGSFRLNRLRGWLQPPVTGNYTLWIASDNSSELWLNPDGNPTEARRIAFVKLGDWTYRQEWTRFPTQRSEPVYLRAGQPCYIEVLHEDQIGGSHLAVAWEGPEVKQSVIEGRYLIPWDSASRPENSTTQGILREYWTNHRAASFAPLTSGLTPEAGLTVREMEVAVLENGVWPEPAPITVDQQLAPEDVYRWVEGEAALSFLGSDNHSATVELAAGVNRMLLRVARYRGSPPPLSPRLRAKFRGVCEGVREHNNELKAGFIWVPSEQDISFFERAATPAEAVESVPVEPGPRSPGLGGWCFTRGVVTFNDRVRGKECLFVQDPGGSLFISQAERVIDPPLQLGQLVEIGGHLVHRQYAPGINFVAASVFGWQNLPKPELASAPVTAANYRDGLWMEMEGVARAVNPDGTMVLMGDHGRFLIWIGQAEREQLAPLVNARLRVRGVMSLDILDGPALLVPSRNFVEVVKSAPKLPDQSAPIASLKMAGSENERAHQVKVAGVVTYRNDRNFFLQDGSGSVFVQPLNGPPAQVGSAVVVVGFVSTESTGLGLTEAVWRPQEAGSQAASARLNLQKLDLASNGALVSVEAQLLAQKMRGADRVLELQAGDTTFEAVLAPDGELGPFAAGSTLQVTGICILEPTAAPVSVSSSPDVPGASLVRLLLRDVADVRLLHGPPWWTLKRTAILVGVLLAVLAASLLRIEYLKRRFARQQAARVKFTRDILESRESERRRIAASLHDSLGQDLLVIRSQTHLALQSATDPSALRQRLEEISSTALQAIEEVREITQNLRPYQLDRLGLSQAIRAVARRVSENCPVVFACHVDEIDDIFDQEFEIHIYRIIQEGINNILKHADATEAAVVIKKAKHTLQISIRDNGRGLAANGASSAAGFGLGGIRERAQIMGGTVKVDSSPEQGVALLVEIPIQPKPICASESPY